MYRDEYTPLRDFIMRFISVTEEEWNLHRDFLSRRFLKKGEFLLREGEVCDQVSFINKGSFRVSASIKDKEVSHFFFFENEYATDYESFLTRTPTRENIQAMEDSEVMNLNYKNMQVLYEKIPAWQKYGRLIGEYAFLMSSQRVKELFYYSPEELYLKLMKERPKIIERVPQQYIASYLGIQPESLSRIRKRLMEKAVN
jgi:CRP/FNR family transcriptional regulator, anaerobic regulatory protein